MPIKAGYSTPMYHVGEIERSIAFYQKLGFELIDNDGCNPIGWARMHCQGGAIMFLRAEHAIDVSAQASQLVMYTEDLAGLREQLLAAGVHVTEIRRPEYMPSGEMSVYDPDGYLLFINGWGEKEHSEWLKRIGREKVY